MMKRTLVALAVLALLLVAPRMASAAVTASLAVNGPNPYFGTCPDTVAFKGTISGTPGTVLTYSFNRFVNGVQQVVPGATLTMPSGGSIAVNDSIAISTATGGNTFDQIWVHNIAGGQPDVYSNKADFTVTCFILPPKGIVFTVLPPAPDSLTNTTDPPTCTNHAGMGGGLSCLALIPKGDLALIWNWSPVKGVPALDGYKVYRVDGGQHTLIYTQANGKDVTLALVPPPSDGFNGKCYVVTAYVGKGESHDSSYFCAGGYQGGPIVESFNLTPNNQRTVDHHYTYTGFGPGCGLSTVGTGPNPGLWVGFSHVFDSSAGVTCYEDTFVDQTAVSFNLGAAGIILRNPKASVQSATLTFQRTDGTNTSCLAGLRLATADWTGAKDLIPNTDYYKNIPTGNGVSVNAGGVTISGSNYSFAVSKPIDDWAKDVSPNYGWVLTGGNEDTSGFHDNNRCESSYGGFALSIKVVINP
jgi:hypothetical protein